MLRKSRLRKGREARALHVVIPNAHLDPRHTSASSRRIPPELCSFRYPPKKEGAGKAGCRPGTHGPLRANSAKRLHSGIQVKPKHSAFPAQWFDDLCRALPGAEFLLASLALRKSRTPRRLTRMPPPQELDRSNDGQDHTVLPYARSQRRSSTQSLGLTESNPPCPRLSRPTLLRPPQPGPRFERLANRPSSVGRAASIYAANPNFGKVEYFCEKGLTEFGGGRVFCPTDNGR